MSKKPKIKPGRRGVCRLCKNEGELCDSHVIPEFLYAPLYDHQHRLQRISTKGQPKRKFEQKGIRERLLCSTCEGKFSAYERHARGVLLGGESIEIVPFPPIGFRCRVDYRKFKLFELSILWRVGVSSLPEFVNVDLGADEEVLRTMLIHENPGASEEYGTIVIWPISNRDIYDELILSAGVDAFGSQKAVKLVFGGLCWYQFLSLSAGNPRHAGLYLQDTGELKILFDDSFEREFAERLAQELYESDPQRFVEAVDGE